MSKLDEAIRRCPLPIRLIVALAIVFIAIASSVSVLLLLGYFSGLDRCTKEIAAQGPWICTGAGRVIFLFVYLALVIPVGWRISKYAQSLIYKSPDLRRRNENDPVTSARRCAELGLGQYLISGPVSFSRERFSVDIGDCKLKLASAFAPSTGLLKPGDEAFAVYQEISSRTRICLAFCVTRSAQVVGVATWGQAFYVCLSIYLIFSFRDVPLSIAMLFALVMAVTSLGYSLVAFRARIALRKYLSENPIT